MPKWTSDLYISLKKSLERALQSSSFSTRSHQLLKENVVCQSTKSDIFSANKAITMHCRNGEAEHARYLFDKMHTRTVVSWNTMITGYSKWDMFSEAVDLVSLMHHSDVKLNDTTFSVSLSVCGRARFLTYGEEIHGLVMKSGHERFNLVGSALLYVYANCYEIEDGKKVFNALHIENELLWSLMLVGYTQCNLLNDALNVFNRMPKRGVVEWTTLISGYAKMDDGCTRALELFETMRNNCEVFPNEFTLDSVLRACGKLGNLWKGREVHSLLVKLGFEFECSIKSALIYFYAKCEAMNDAMKVYSGIINQGLDDTNQLLGGLLKLSKIEEAELIFRKMSKRDTVSYNLMIKGYAFCGLFEDSERLFMEMPVKTLASMNTMIVVYARNSEVGKAMMLFEKTKEERNPITWNSMISGYILNEQHENALKLYQTMRRSSVSQTRSTFSVLFHACARLGSLQQGQLFHGHSEKSPFSSNIHVGTALIHMYSKCGSIADALLVFRCIHSPNVASWTSLINGYAHHGLGFDAVSCFNLMLEGGITPNAATFVAVLSACSRAGLISEGMRLFHLMKEHYNITPSVEHFTCIMDIVGRSGLLKEFREFISGIDTEHDKIMLSTMLNASWFSMDMEIGELVAEKMFMLGNCSSSACVMMSNMYSLSGMWEEKMNIREVLKDSGVKKDRGCSWLDVNNECHVFSVDDRVHPEFKGICASLESVMRNVHTDTQIDSLTLH